MKRKKIKKKKEKNDILKQINPNNISTSKKTNLKNTYINKINFLMNENDNINGVRDSNSETE